jgi:Pyruvate/2-oxoacid:ferredoxin oxidoreductase delta subunit
VRPFILKEKCPAQADICKAINACPNHAVSYVEDDGEPLGGRIEIDHAKCTGCGTCAKECCGMAIIME